MLCINIFMTKGALTLSIDTEILEMARKSDINISQTVEDILRSVLQQSVAVDEPAINIDAEVAKHMMEIKRLQTKAELMHEQADKNKEEIMIVDNMIDNMVQFKDPLNPVPDSRAHGLTFLFNKRLHKQITQLQAKEMLENRIKERGLIKEPEA